MTIIPDYETLTRIYDECSQGTEEPTYTLVGPHVARLSDHRQARRLRKRGWVRGHQSLPQGKTIWINPNLFSAQ